MLTSKDLERGIEAESKVAARRESSPAHGQAAERFGAPCEDTGLVRVGPLARGASETGLRSPRRPRGNAERAAPYTSTTHCRLFARWLTVRGIDPATLLAEVELSRAEVERFDVLMPTHKFLRFLRLCEDATRDADLGLHAGEQVRIEDLDLLGLVLRGSPCASDAYQVAQQYRALWGHIHEAELTLREDVVTCTQAAVARRGVPRHWGEYFAAVTLTLARAVVGRSVEAREVRFVHSAPDSLAEHRRVFGGAKLVFEARSNEVLFSGQLLHQPLPHADTDVVRVLTPYLQRLSAKAPSISAPDLPSRVRNVALENLADGRLSIRSVARKLHQSERTLSRQLSASATSFREILNQLRRDLALHYLEQGLSAVEVSRQLGFAEPNTFHRAFRRWTGTSVGEYRRGGAATHS